MKPVDQDLLEAMASDPLNPQRQVEALIELGWDPALLGLSDVPGGDVRQRGQVKCCMAAHYGGRCECGAGGTMTIIDVVRIASLGGTVIAHGEWDHGLDVGANVTDGRHAWVIVDIERHPLPRPIRPGEYVGLVLRSYGDAAEPLRGAVLRVVP